MQQRNMKPIKSSTAKKPLRRRRPVAKTPRITFHVVTLFPESLTSYVETSILGRAITDGYVAVKTYGIRDFSTEKWNRVDRPPYGGGPGMVLEPEPIIRAIAKATSRKKAYRILFTTPRGELFTNAVAKRYADAAATHDEAGTKRSAPVKDIIIVCGRYEGIDARVREVFPMEEISVGDFVLTGGELAALIVMDTTIRQVPGVLGNFDSREESRVSTDYVYTRPESFKWKGKTYQVPEVLRSGDHAAMEAWKKTKEQERGSATGA